MKEKIAFITCVNNEVVYDECVKYIKNLNISYNIEIEFVAIRNVGSMTEGYNIAMKKTYAKYKVYLHQDTFIINKNFINDVLDIFRVNNNIGMLGVVGSKIIPTNAIWWEAKKKYGKVYNNPHGKMKLLEFDEIENKYEKVQAIDGLIMVTQYDIEWRGDIFIGWDFYNLSQCIEFMKSGYDVVIPRQEEPWCLHDCGVISIGENYETLRNIFLNEYHKYIIKTILKEIQSRDLDIYEYIIQWRKYYIEEISDENILKLIDEELLNSLKVECEKPNELFEFDKIKALEIMLHNKEQFDKYLKNARLFLNNKNYEQTALWCFEGAKLASEKHPGFYVSKELESILLECANKLPNKYKKISLPEKNLNKRNVLHVMSEGDSIGGHTRLVKNWIEKDKESIHSLIATWQINSMPDWMLDEVKKSGGWIESLQYIDSFLERAIALRKVAYEWADIVVLHIHMYDVIPIMAFGVEGGPPVVFMNHADHCFWIGSSIADLVCNIRPSAEKLVLERRGNNKTIILPIPLEDRKINSLDKLDIREKLNIDKEAVVLLSIASSYKFNKINHIHFIDIIKPLVNKYTNMVVLIIGPDDIGIWNEANIETNGRIRALGVQQEIEKYYSCADIYIDSYPLSSMTATLDAGLHKLGILGLKDDRYITCANDDLAASKYYYYDSSELQNFIEDIVNDKSKSKEFATACYENINKIHNCDWVIYLNDIYKRTQNITHRIETNSKADEFSENDLFYITLKQL